jgi:N-acetylneuraminate synthase/sialic acid synthase
VISTFCNLYKFPIGFSDHSLGITAPLIAFAKGARIIEKHFTIDRSMKGTDHAFSLEPAGFEKMVRDLKLLKVALGDGHKKIYDKEKEPIRKMSKMLVYSDNFSAGTVIKLDHFSLKSPCDGLNPQAIDYLINKKLLMDVSINQIVKPEDFDIEDF